METYIFLHPEYNYAARWHQSLTHAQKINNHFCSTCGTTLFRTGGEPSMSDKVGLRAGVLDDQSILDKPPALEVYVERRPRVSKATSPWRRTFPPAGTRMRQPPAGFILFLPMVN